MASSTDPKFVEGQLHGFFDKEHAEYFGSYEYESVTIFVVTLVVTHAVADEVNFNRLVGREFAYVGPLGSYKGKHKIGSCGLPHVMTSAASSELVGYAFYSPAEETESGTAIYESAEKPGEHIVVTNVVRSPAGFRECVERGEKYLGRVSKMLRGYELGQK
jgi:hypothetical protein